MDITLALGGGGAKGNAHIGVLRKLEAEGFRVRAVAGTSFGGIVASMYAFGKTPDQIEELFAGVDQNRLYGHAAGDGPSLLGLAGASKLFDDAFGAATFDDLHLPCALTGVDLKSAREVILTEGLVRDALLATIALPGIFPPRKIQDWELVDGGTLDPVPVQVARMLAPGLPVVAVVLTSPVGEPTRTMEVNIPYIPHILVRRITRMRPAQAFDIFLQAVDIGNRQMAELQLEADDPEVIIRPAVTHIQLLDKVDVHEVAKLGEAAVDAVLPELKRVTAWPAKFARKIGMK
ncbi:MAG: patatin-like phospholipase family protein [Chloroflexi bacterium]|nr:patatin-like phospholipase family protein [Chloroflexota bacterium]